MQLNNKHATQFQPATRDLVLTTHLCVGAHPDDLEIMAFSAISQCYGQPHMGFVGVTVTNGSGSPRSGKYADYSDDQMTAIRRLEQNQAADIGKYLAQFQLDYTSQAVKSSAAAVVDDLLAILTACRPAVIYMHNLFDKHPTHLAVAILTLEALRQLPIDLRPRQVIGVEVWRSLDWLPDHRKVLLDTS
ncbi:MAG: PIG-L family deacetylase, partial [Eubacteriales bacterium]|nr:PIG-L family deacetylase [Eubacteriales bacterium]